MMLLSALFATLASAQSLEIVGACPGVVTFVGEGFRPHATVTLLASSQAGSDALPSGSCAGLVTELARPSRGGLRVLGPTGTFSLPTELPGSACGQKYQAVDLKLCRLSNVADVELAAPELEPGADGTGDDTGIDLPLGDRGVADEG